LVASQRMGESRLKVVAERHGHLGVLTLNRPQAINSLDLEMVEALTETLEGWRDDDLIAAVLLRGVGDRGFCAGGDLILVRDAINAGELEAARWFWRKEYGLNARIAGFPKPVVALMEGVVMGGGVGLAGHADHRLVVPGARVAMPEVKIGLAPDVGGSFLLARAPGEIGTHLALTGRTIGAREAVEVGLADVVAPADTGERLIGALEGGDVEGGLAALLAEAGAAPAEPSKLTEGRAWIDSCYRGDSVEEIVAGLEADPDPEARATVAEIGLMSPLSLKVALRAIRNARAMESVEECLRQDLRVSGAFLSTHDLPEGIRAVLVDKDRRPRWDPAGLEGVEEWMVARHFAPIPDELEFR
jgi:enoyl-CoA hydratase